MSFYYEVNKINEEVVKFNRDRRTKEDVICTIKTNDTENNFRLGQRCTSRAHRTVCEDVCSSACTRANDATARPGM
jgi:hypothetical protein